MNRLSTPALCCDTFRVQPAYLTAITDAIIACVAMDQFTLNTGKCDRLLDVYHHAVLLDVCHRLADRVTPVTTSMQQSSGGCVHRVLKQVPQA